MSPWLACVDFGRSILAILKNGLVKDVESKKLVLVGHSAGAVSRFGLFFLLYGHRCLSTVLL